MVVEVISYRFLNSLIPIIHCTQEKEFVSLWKYVMVKMMLNIKEIPCFEEMEFITDLLDTISC
jgi:hypothetical protein